MRYSTWKPWRRCPELSRFSEADARRCWILASRLTSGSIRNCLYLLPYLVVFVAGMLVTLWAGERFNVKDGPLMGMLAIAIVAPSPLMFLNVRWVERERMRWIRRIAAGEYPSRLRDCCPQCEYSLLGLERRELDRGAEVRCPECGVKTVLTSREVALIEMRELGVV